MPERVQAVDAGVRESQYCQNGDGGCAHEENGRLDRLRNDHGFEPAHDRVDGGHGRDDYNREKNVDAEKLVEYGRASVKAETDMDEQR